MSQGRSVGGGRQQDRISVAECLGALWASRESPDLGCFFWEQVAWEASRTGGTGFLHIEGGRRELEQRLGVWWPACQQKPVCVRVGNAVAGRTG